MTFPAAHGGPVGGERLASTSVGQHAGGDPEMRSIELDAGRKPHRFLRVHALGHEVDGKMLVALDLREELCRATAYEQAAAWLDVKRLEALDPRLVRARYKRTNGRTYRIFRSTVHRHVCESSACI